MRMDLTLYTEEIKTHYTKTIHLLKEIFFEDENNEYGLHKVI